MAQSKRLDSQLRGYAANPKAMEKDPTFPIFKAGMDRGKLATQHAVLTYLENKYMGDEENEAPPRQSPEAKAILDVARDLAAWLRNYKPDLDA